MAGCGFLLLAALAQERVEKKVHPEAKPVLAFLSKTPSPGLIVALHGTGGSGPGFAGSFPIAQITAAGYIVAFPTSIQGAWSTAATNGTAESRKKDLDHLKALFDTFTKDYGVHPDKIHLIGFSAGGMMSCQATAVAAELDGHRIRSVCAHSGGFRGPPAKESRAKQTSVWVLNGSQDAAHADSSKAMCEMFKAAGYEAKYQEVPGKGHSFPLVPFSEILQWWQTLDKNAPDVGKIRGLLQRGGQELERKNYGSAYRSFEEAKKDAAGKSEGLLKEAEAGLAKVEQEARRLLAEADSAKEKEPAAAKKILKEMTTRFARTPFGDEAKKKLAEIK